MSIETVYFNQRADDKVVADFSPGVQRLTFDDIEFGFALKQTLKVLNVTPEIPSSRTMILQGTIQDVATYLPWLQEQELAIATASSFEQGGIYKPGRAPEIRDAVRDALGEVLITLPSTVTTGNFLDICQVVIKPFAEAVMPDTELSIVQGIAPLRQAAGII